MTRIAYNVDVDTESIQSAIDYFTFLGGNTDQALRIAINKAGPKVRTMVSEAIRSQVNLPQAYLNEKDKGGKQRLAFVRATTNKLTGSITTPSRGLLLSRYSTVKAAANFVPGGIRPPNPPRGIRVKVKPGSSPKQVKGRPGDIKGKPFYMILPDSRALAIAARRAKPGKAKGKIRVFHGASLSQVFNTVRDDVLPEAQEELQGQLLDAMRYLLQKRYPQE